MSRNSVATCSSSSTTASITSTVYYKGLSKKRVISSVTLNSFITNAANISAFLPTSYNPGALSRTLQYDLSCPTCDVIDSDTRCPYNATEPTIFNPISDLDKLFTRLTTPKTTMSRITKPPFTPCPIPRRTTFPMSLG